jgi:hypothetical protein
VVADLRDQSAGAVDYLNEKLIRLNFLNDAVHRNVDQAFSFPTTSDYDRGNFLLNPPRYQEC